MKKHLQLLAVGFILAAVFYTACQKHEKTAEISNPESIGLAELPFSKLLVIMDRKQENAVTLKISAIDQAILDRYTERSFELKPIFEDVPAEAAQETTESTTPESSDAPVTESFIVIDEQLQDEVLGYELALAEEPGRVEDRGWVTSALIGNSCTRRMQINNWGPNITVRIHLSPLCVNNWSFCCNYNHGCQILNYCNIWGGGIAAKISYWTPKRWSMTMFINC